MPCNNSPVRSLSADLWPRGQRTALGNGPGRSGLGSVGPTSSVTVGPHGSPRPPGTARQETQGELVDEESLVPPTEIRLRKRTHVAPASSVLAVPGPGRTGASTRDLGRTRQDLTPRHGPARQPRETSRPRAQPGLEAAPVPPQLALTRHACLPPRSSSAPSRAGVSSELGARHRRGSHLPPQTTGDFVWLAAPRSGCGAVVTKLKEVTVLPEKEPAQQLRRAQDWGPPTPRLHPLPTGPPGPAHPRACGSSPSETAPPVTLTPRSRVSKPRPLRLQNASCHATWSVQGPPKALQRGPT